jgi:hypothetical protein
VKAIEYLALVTDAAQQGIELPISQVVSDSAGEQQWRHQLAQGSCLRQRSVRNEEIGLEQMDEIPPSDPSVKFCK